MSKVAIFEDTNVLRIRIVNILMDQGYDEIEYIKPSIASITVSSPTVPDVKLLIIDLDNHEVDSIEYIRRFKADTINQHIPIIALSKNSDISSLKKAVRAGCTDFILKPFNDEALIIKVDKLIGKMKGVVSSMDQFRSSSSVMEEDEQMLSWVKDFEIGVEEIDQDHKEIILEFEKLYQLMKEGLGHDYYHDLIAYLIKYVNWHFDHEEKLQESISYPYIDEHKKIHEEFKNSILTIAKEHENKVITNADLIKINIFLKNWLIHHILIEDRKIADYIKEEN